MRREGFLLPALSVGLVQAAISLDLIALNLRDSGQFDHKPAAALHFLLALAAGFALQQAVKRGLSPRWFALPSAALTLFCAAVLAQSDDMRYLVYSAQGDIISSSASVLLIWGATLSLRAVPAGNEGFFYGLILAFQELLWITLFPLLIGAGDNPQSVRPLFLHLSSFCTLFMGGSALCLSVALYRHGAMGAGQALIADRPDPPFAGGQSGLPQGAAQVLVEPPAVCDATRPAFLWLFAAGIGLFILVGLEMGMRLPKTALTPEFIDISHVIPLFFLPLAGKKLDADRPGNMVRLLAFFCLAAPFSGLALTSGLVDPLAQFCLLMSARQILVLFLFTTCARLIKIGASLPLMLALAYCLHLWQFVGFFLQHSLSSASSPGFFTAALALASASAFCLMRLSALLRTKSELWALTRREIKPPETDTQKFHAFAVAHALTGRERDILLKLIQGASREELEEESGLSARTVRHHLTGLLKKTETPERKSLLRYYDFWKK